MKKLLRKIRVKNFISYKNCNLDIDSKGIAVYGPNGAGKTALMVEAVTYALYGKTYRTDQKEVTVQDIMPPGSQNTEVEIQVELNGKKYNIDRRRLRTAGGGLWIKSEGKIVAQGKKAEEYIRENLLGMDYKTFISTCVIRQGEVELFSEKTPSKRREMLLEIFNLKMDDYKEKAKTEMKKLENEINRIEAENKLLIKEIEREQEIRNEIQKATGRLRQLESIQKEKESKLKEIENMLNQKNVEYTNTESKLEVLKKMREELEKRKEYIKKKEKEIEKTKKLIGMKDSITNTIEKLKSRRKQVNEAIKLAIQIENLRRNLKERVKSREEVKNNIKAFEREIKEIGKKIEKLRKARETIKKLGEPEKIEEEIKKLEEEIREIHRIQTETMKWKNEVKSFIEKLKQGNITTCPLCGSKIPPDQAKHIIEKHSKEIEEVESRLEQLQNKLKIKEYEKKEKQNDLYKAKNAYTTIENLKDVETEMEYKSNQLIREKKKDKEYENEIMSIENEINTFNREIAGKTGIPIELVNQKSLEERLNRIDEKLRKNQALLEESSRSEGKVETLTNEIEKLKMDVKDLESKVSKLADVENKAKKLKNELQTLEEAKKNINKEIQEIREEKGKLKAQIDNYNLELNKIEKFRKTLEENKKKLEEYNLDYRAAKILKEKVFHERGLPLAILKHQLARTTLHAQEYLNRFMGGEYEVKLTTNENGDVEINMYVNGRRRHIRTFSSGERTMIGFALRLGLIKAISEFTGSKHLGLLIIDEGFSNLDGERRNALGTILAQITNEFDRVIVISHLPEIREFFPQAINVYKSEDGYSQIRIYR